MGTVSGPWAGQLYGEEPGELYAELSGPDEAVAGVLSIHLRSGDIEVLSCSGALAGGCLDLVCRPALPEAAESRLGGTLSSDGQLTGELTQAGRAAAAFALFPQTKQDPADPPAPQPL